jgi:hypothetical protein
LSSAPVIKGAEKLFCKTVGYEPVRPQELAALYIGHPLVIGLGESIVCKLIMAVLVFDSFDDCEHVRCSGWFVDPMNEF